MPLTKRESAILRAYQRMERIQEKAAALYAKADHAGAKLAKKAFKLKTAKKVSDFTCAVRISEEGKHLLVTAQLAEAAADAANGGEGKVWAHAAARPWKFATKNLD
jgi:hypothetical protein